MLEQGLQIKQIENINALIDRYQGFLIDLWGVVYDGAHAYPGVVEGLNTLINRGKKIIFLSNAPRPGQLMVEKLVQFGIKVSSDMVLTSGDAVRHQLSYFEDPFFEQHGRCFYHLGAERNTDILSGLSVNATDSLEKANFVLLTLYRDEGEDLQPFHEFFKKALDHNLPMLCANPDKIIPNGAKRRFCAGVFAEQYESMGGKVHYYGKPHPNVYELCFKRFQEWGILDKSQIVMIGDTLETDILGANRMGIDSALVLTGNMRLLLNTDKVGEAERQLKRHLQGLSNAYLTPSWLLQKLAYCETR